VFSSDYQLGGITVFDAPMEMRRPMFISLDPPVHDEQRKAVSPIVAPSNLANLEGLIRQRVCTILDGLPRNATFLAELARELKRACGSGGAVRESAVEIQGDHRDRLRALLGGKGWTVKG
jgi:cytochrome P450